MASPGEATENPPPSPAARQTGETLASSTYNAMETSYPSPTPSARPLLPTPSAPIQTPAAPDGTKGTGQSAKNAQEFWKQHYAKLERCNQPSNKRKNSGDGEDRGRAKRRQKADGVSQGTEQTRSSLPEGASGPATPVSGCAESGEIDAQRSSLGGWDQRELMQLLGQDVDMNDPQACQDLHRLHGAVLSFGDGKCKFMDGRWKIDGFGTPLYPHQLIGVSWMLSRELHPTGPKGGILADKMGLGKTVQLLACMSQNPPRKKKSNKATKTLIIARKTLIPQWYKEIMSHCSQKKMKNVFVYTGGRIMMPNQFEEANIVLTNYEQVQRQSPPAEILRQIDDLRMEGNPAWKDLMRKHTPGILFQIDWHRVVLDEAHRITTRSSQTSKGCILLVRHYSWALTGTPMANNTDEFFPYMDFLRTGHSFSEFRSLMGEMATEEQRRKLREVYNQITLGRRDTDTLMGRPILQLPPPHRSLVTVEFSSLEVAMHQRAWDELTKLRVLPKAPHGASGVSGSPKPKGQVNRLFHYLRYFTAHPALVEQDYFSKQATHAETQRSTEADTATTQYFCRLCCKVLVEPMIAKCGHGFCNGCLKKSRPCLSCGSVPEDVRPGGDECIHHNTTQFEDLLRRFAVPGLTSKEGRMKRSRYAGDDEFGLKPLLTQRRKTTRGKGRKKGTTSKNNKGRGSRKGKKAKRDATAEQTRSNAANFLKACDKAPWNPIPHSAKSRAAMDLVAKWQEEAPDDKIIIFTQWIPILSILGRMLFQRGFKFVYLWGEMKTEQQEMSVRAFQEVPEIKIMLISVTCGAHGLNLTAANRVIVYDHWWHLGLQEQAFGRVRRIGQTKEVHLAKLVAVGSMDEAILSMQKTKEENIEGAIGKGDAQPTFHEICEIMSTLCNNDKGILELTRLEDISDDEWSENGDDDGSSGSDSDSDDGDSDDDSDEGSDTDDSSSSSDQAGSSYEADNGDSNDEDSDDE